MVSGFNVADKESLKILAWILNDSAQKSLVTFYFMTKGSFCTAMSILGGIRQRLEWETFSNDSVNDLSQTYTSFSTLHRCLLHFVVILLQWSVDFWNTDTQLDQQDRAFAYFSWFTTTSVSFQQMTILCFCRPNLIVDNFLQELLKGFPIVFWIQWCCWEIWCYSSWSVVYSVFLCIFKASLSLF